MKSKSKGMGTYMIVVIIFVAILAVVMILLAIKFKSGVGDLAGSMIDAITGIATKAISSILPGL